MVSLAHFVIFIFFILFLCQKVFKKSVSQALAGENLGALLRGVRLEALHRGMTLCSAGSQAANNRYCSLEPDCCHGFI